MPLNWKNVFQQIGSKKLSQWQERDMTVKSSDGRSQGRPGYFAARLLMPRAHAPTMMLTSLLHWPTRWSPTRKMALYVHFAALAGSGVVSR